MILIGEKFETFSSLILKKIFAELLNTHVYRSMYILVYSDTYVSVFNLGFIPIAYLYLCFTHDRHKIDLIRV